MRHPYGSFVHRVARPARYLGGEYLQVKKRPEDVDVRVCLAFPDVYEIGMSHMGTKILYSVLNKHERIACERAFTPWVDMEKELRERNLPLVSLESATPLSDFDVIGMSLQYEMTYTNVLTLLDLAGIPLRAAARRERDPLILGGGPTATHPEPVAPFFDALFIGEGEEKLPPLCLEWAALRRAGAARRDALAELASRYPLYVPSLYETEECPLSGLEVVKGPADPRAPAKVVRALVENIDDYPFPTDTPVPYAEAVFDRAGVEIARGCTEGCRFCQAGMIYRPVRERDPESIVRTIEGLIETGGYDEASMTALSTADVSCITPLVKTVMARLRDKKVSLSISSLRAYGLNEDLLDELASVRATGLTFAPEAGTQRMRDVVNKNVTEDHIRESAERVFKKGWHRLKLYFMIGLPTEEDEDVLGIVETGARMLRIGRERVGKKADVTVSVSSHVPKPHTPFQWCAMDTMDELDRKQRLLRDHARSVWPRVRLKVHEKGISMIEGVIARGDRRVADVIEAAWRSGARFDGWDELFELDRWIDAFARTGVDPARYLGTIPTDARLPWDHIDVGLADGFLAWEYRRSLKNRLSPPCGKPNKTLIHHTNVQDAVADQRKLVCYDCGVACDMTRMREERIVFLRKLGAETPPEPRPATGEPPSRGCHPVPRVQFQQGRGSRYRLRYTKAGRAAFIGHLDMMRLLMRIFRRAGFDVVYSQGFHPKPLFVFGPALGLGVASLGEPFEVRIEGEPDAGDLKERLNEVSPEGIVFSDAVRLGDGAPGLTHQIQVADFVLRSSHDAARLREKVAAFEAGGEVLVARKKRAVDLKSFIIGFDVLEGDAARGLGQALGWPEGALLTVRVTCGPEGSARPSEIAEALGLGEVEMARMALLGLGPDGTPTDPLQAPAPPAWSAPPDEQRQVM